jgi:hypothetical protein
MPKDRQADVWQLAVTIIIFAQNGLIALTQQNSRRKLQFLYILTFLSLLFERFSFSFADGAIS